MAREAGPRGGFQATPPEPELRRGPVSPKGSRPSVKVNMSLALEWEIMISNESAYLYLLELGLESICRAVDILLGDHV